MQEIDLQLGATIGRGPIPNPSTSERIGTSDPTSNVFTPEPSSRRAAMAERALKRLKKARWAHEDHQLREAKRLYVEASDLCVQALRETGDEQSTARLQIMAKEALDRAESLRTGLRLFAEETGAPAPPTRAEAATAAAPPKRLPPGRNTPAAVPSEPIATDGGLPPPLLGPVRAESTSPQPNPAAASIAAGYTKDELTVLRRGSEINGKCYLPWVLSDQHEDFRQPAGFRDPDGALRLSEKQKNCFKRWVRPQDLAYVRVCERKMHNRVFSIVLSSLSQLSCRPTSSRCPPSLSV